MSDEDDEEEEEGQGGGEGEGGGGGGDDKVQFRKAMDSIMVARTSRGPATRGDAEAKSPQKILVAVGGVVGLLVVVGGAIAFVIYKMQGGTTTTTSAPTTTTMTTVNETASGNSTGSTFLAADALVDDSGDRAVTKSLATAKRYLGTFRPRRVFRRPPTGARSQLDYNMIFAEEADEFDDFDEGHERPGRMTFAEEPAANSSSLVNAAEETLVLGDEPMEAEID